MSLLLQQLRKYYDLWSNRLGLNDIIILQDIIVQP